METFFAMATQANQRVKLGCALRRFFGSCILRFGACAAFIFSTACTLAKSPEAILSIRGSDNHIASAAVPIAAGRSEPVPGWDSHPLWISAFSRRTQVSQQCNRTGPPHSEETRVAGEGVWLLSDRVADTTGNRNSTHDSEGPSEVVGKRGCGGPRSLHRLAVRPRCLTRFDNSQLCSDTNRFSKNFATKPSEQTRQQAALTIRTGVPLTGSQES